MGQVLSTALSAIVFSVCEAVTPKSFCFKKLTELAITPTRGSAEAAGYDLYSAYDVVVPAQGKALVKTDIAVALPQGCYGRVAPRLEIV